MEYLHSNKELLDLLIDDLGISRSLAWKFHDCVRNYLFNHLLPVPIFFVVDIIDSNEDIIGVFRGYEEDRIYLSKNIFELNEVGRIFYVMHELVHFVDFKMNNKLDLTEYETDQSAKDFLIKCGIWNEMYHKIPYPYPIK